MDLTDTIIPKSDQLNAEDLLSGPRTFTITDVRAGGDDQPVNIHLAESPGRPFRPSKTVRRILVAAWGKDGDAYVGRRLVLYRDPAVKWAGQEIGGIRVSHMSHIDKPMKLALTVTKGKREPYVVQPLPDEPARPAQQPAKATRAETGEAITPAQLTALNAALSNDLGLTDRDQKLAYLSEKLGRPVTSSKEVTKAEASGLLDRIKSWTEPQAEPPEDDR